MYTTKTQYRNFETSIPRKRIARLSPNFHVHVSVSDLHKYSHDGSVYSAAGKYVDRSWEYVNRSHTQEFGHLGRGHAIFFLGIHKWNFRCSKRQVLDRLNSVKINLETLKYVTI